MEAASFETAFFGQVCESASGLGFLFSRSTTWKHWMGIPLPAAHCGVSRVVAFNWRCAPPLWLSPPLSIGFMSARAAAQTESAAANRANLKVK